MVAKVIGGTHCKVIIGKTSYHLATGCTYPLDGAEPREIATVRVNDNSYRSAIYAFVSLSTSRAQEFDLHQEFSNNYIKE